MRASSKKETGHPTALAFLAVFSAGTGCVAFISSQLVARFKNTTFVSKSLLAD
jgi:hypothetical protein